MIKINLAKSAGFCFGVKRALKIALETIAPGTKVCMLGDIVHNEDVVKQINKAGIKKITRLSPQRNKILLIRAHGAPLATLKKAKQLGYKIVDATCPMVKEIHKKAQDMEQKGYKIIVIGDKKHDEVQGIVGQLKTKAIVIDNINTIPARAVRKIHKACVVSQSTQNLETVMGVVNLLRKRVGELEFCNTICMPTRIKQEEIKKLPLKNDVVIIIGSKESANTKRLYEISKSLNRRTYWVSSGKELEKGWFRGVKSVGITSGASTPEGTTRDVIELIRRWQK